MRRTPCRELLLVSLAFFPACAWAWPGDPAVNLPLCVQYSQQTAVSACPDGTGGIIVAWSDRRSGGYADVYAQRVSAAGVPQWADGGVLVTDVPFDQDAPAITSDGVGGAIVVWQDQRTAIDVDLFAQRLTHDGLARWAANGVPVCTANYDQFQPRIAADGLHGAFVAWDDNRVGDGGTAYTQHVDSTGACTWIPDGILLGQPNPNNTAPPLFLVADLTGGEIVAWASNAQRLTAGGAMQWGSGGTIVAGFPIQGMVADSTGGAIITGIANGAVYGQRIAPGGGGLWGTAGTPLCAVPGHKNVLTIACDSAGSAVTTWRDGRNGLAGDVFAQRVDPQGHLPWGASGVPVCTQAPVQDRPVIVSDGSGGTVTCWMDYRSYADADLYAQRLTHDGTPVWTVDGVPVTTATGDQVSAGLVSDGAGGVFAVWTDRRADVGDIYAQWLDGAGEAGGVTAVPRSTASGVALAAPWPSPSTAAVSLAFTLDQPGPARIEVLDASGRRVAVAAEGSFAAGRHVLRWDGRDAGGDRVRPGVYLVRLTTRGASSVRRIVRL